MAYENDVFLLGILTMMNKHSFAGSIKSLLSKDLHFAVLIAVLSFSLGITGIILNGMRFSPDSTGFHNYAVNIIAGRGYTSELGLDPPTKLNREPGYPIFLGSVYRIYSALGRVSYIKTDDYNLSQKRLLSYYPEIWIIKYLQAMLLAIGVVLFYKSLLPFFSVRICKISALLLSIFYPYHVFSSFLLREPLIAFFTILLGYLLSRYYATHKETYLLGASVVLALGSLTWQAYIAFTPIIPVMLWLTLKDPKMLITRSILSGIAYIVLVSPWLWFSYSQAQDLRIIKSMGTTYTHELMNYVAAMDEAVFYKLMSAEEKRQLEDKWYYNLSSLEVVTNSFEGVYDLKADSIQTELGSRGISGVAYLFNSTAKRLGNLFFQTHWPPFRLPRGMGSLLRTFREEGFLQVFMGLGMVIISLLLGVSSIIGLFMLPARDHLAILPLWGFLMFFYPIGSVSRRFMPIIPWMILLSVFALSSVYQRYLSSRVVRTTKEV